MPYINQEDRERMRHGTTDEDLLPQNVGELNFLITTICNAYMLSKGGLSYTNINDVIGVLECAKLEAYRRLAVDYENQKIQENGDVYTVV